MTGRGAGYCAGSSVPGYGNPAVGRGFGRGFGRGLGRGFGRGRGVWGRGRQGWYGAPPMAGWAPGYPMPYEYPAPPQPPDPELEKQALKGQVGILQSQLEFLRKRLEELETVSETE